MARGEVNTAKKGRQSKAERSTERTSGSNHNKSTRGGGKSSRTGQGDPTRWTFFSNHAHVLICLYQDSEMVLRNIASRVGITERAVQSIIQDLEDAGYLERERVGRCNHYHVIHNKHLRHPIEEHCTVDMLFDVILENA